MAHQLTAEVWRHVNLLPGLDAAVLRHLLSRLNEAASWAPRDTLRFRIHFICWAKTIIDHQRARLQATDGVSSLSQETIACSLISQDLIFITISALLDVKKRLFPPDSTTASAHICCRIYILAAVVCTFRLLLLRNEAIPRVKLNELIRHMNANWKHARLMPVEQFFMYDLIPDTVRRLLALPSTITASTYYRGLGIPTYEDITNVRLRNIAIYTRHICGNSPPGYIRGSFSECAESYWRMFDVIWAADAAVIQCFNVDVGKPMDAIAGWTTGEDRLYNALQVRALVLDGVYLGNAHQHEGPARISLTASLSAWEYVSPSNKEEPIAHLFELGPGRNQKRTTSAGTFLYDCSPYIQAALNSLLDWLREVGPNIPRPDSPLLPHARTPLVPYFRSVVKAETGAELPSAPPLPFQAQHFTFTTSGQHLLVWDSTLQGVLRYKLDTSLSMDVVERKDYLMVGYDVISAAGGSEATAILANSDILSLEATVVASRSRYNATQMHSLMLYRHDELIESFMLGESSAIEPNLTAVTVNRADSLVALCLNGILSVYEIGRYDCHQLAFDDRVAFYQNLAQKRTAGSRAANGLTRRLTTRRSLTLQVLTERHLQDNMEALGSIRERKISFTPTNNHLVVATLFANDHVYIDVFTYNGHSITIATSHPAIFTMSPTLPADGGLTAVLLNEEAMEAVFVADLSRPYPVHVQLAYCTNPAAEALDYGKKAICAAQASDGKAYVLVTGLGEVLSVVYKTSSPRFSTKEVKRLRRAAIGLPRGLGSSDAAVTVVDSGRAVLAWRSRSGELIVRVLQLHSEEYSDYSLS